VTLSIGLVSYGLAAVAFLLLALLLAVSWEGRSQGVRLVIATALTCIWASVHAVSAWGGVTSIPLIAFVEALRAAAWIAVLTGLGAAIGIDRRLLAGVHVALAVAIAACVAMPWLLPSAEQQFSAMVAGSIGLSLLGLVMLEQVYRNAHSAQKYSLRYLVIALGIFFAYDLFVFAQAQMLSAIDASAWAARGLIAAMTVPLLAIAARRNPQWALNIFVSRQVVFYSATFMAVGIYLLVMSFGGYLIALYGGTWGRAVQFVFFGGMLVVLFSLLASADVRRRARVFLAKHFYRNKYDYRVEWLRFIQTLSEPSNPDDSGATEGSAAGDDPSGARSPYARAIRAVGQLIGSPRGVMHLRRDESLAFSPVAEWPASGGGVEDHALGPAEDMAGFLERRQWVVDLREYRRTPDLYENLILPPALERAGRDQIILPLLEQSRLIGLLLLDYPPPPFTPTYEDRDLLKTVGRHVATYIAQHEADRRLAENRQFEAYHRLTAFVMHDLKNLAAQLSLIVANAEKHKRNPEFVDDAISTVAMSTERMQRLIEQLQGRELRSAPRRIRVVDVLQRAVERCAPKQPVPQIDAATDVYVEADPERLISVVEHIVRNSQDATAADGKISVRAVNGDGHVAITVSDTGCGMTPEFISNRLFRPFDTTKGSKGMGIGAYQAREYVTSLGGSMAVQSAPGEGTTFEIVLKPVVS
jgi:putative PEP-CTERM system histidine kinase